MRTLPRYIIARLAFGWILVFLIMAALFSILELVSQLNDVGGGGYQAKDAFMYVLYTLPGRVLDLAAVSALLGGIVGLGTLANTDELLAMRACGFSVFRIARVLLGAGSVIMLSVLLLNQFVVPPLEQKARINRELALSGEGSLLSTGGFWTRGKGNRFINVRSSASGVGLTDVSLYDFDDQGKPTSFVGSAETIIGKDGRWVCRNARQINFADKRITDQVEPVLNLDLSLNTRQANILSIAPDMLSYDKLYQYIQVLRERGQNTDQFIHLGRAAKGNPRMHTGL